MKNLVVLLVLKINILLAYNDNISKHKQSFYDIVRTNLRDEDVYLIKFLTPHTLYPNKLVDHTNPVAGTDVKWFKYGSNCFIDQLDQHQSYYTFEIAEDPNFGKTKSNLVILNYDMKTNFLLDHYEPRHEKQGINNNAGNNFQENPNEQDEEDRVIYTLVYLNMFEMNKTEIGDDVEISCRINLIVPNGLVDQHTVIISERFESLIHLDLVIHDSPVMTKSFGTSVWRNKRNTEASNQYRKLKQRSSYNNPSLYELEIVEGPIKVNKENFKNFNCSCKLILKDYDHSFVLNTQINKVIVDDENPKSRPSYYPDNTSSSSFVFGYFSLVTLIIITQILYLLL